MRSRRIVMPAVSLCMLVLQSASAVQAQNATSPNASQPRILQNFLTRPLAFESLPATANSPAGIEARGHGYSARLGAQGINLRLAARPKSDPNTDPNGPPSGIPVAPPPYQFATLGMQFVGGAANPKLELLDLLPGKTSYYSGSDPSQWIIDNPTYAKAKYT